MKTVRVAVAALSLSAAAFVGVLTSESFTDTAIVPTKNDRWTVGHGSTFWEDGTPVKKGDTITPTRAARLSVTHIAKDETRLKKCIKAPLSQAEYDILVDFSYQYGANTACSSLMMRLLNAQHYTESCEAYTAYRRSGGYDCSTLINGKPNKRCWGVWKRSLERREKCLAAQ